MKTTNPKSKRQQITTRQNKSRGQRTGSTSGLAKQVGAQSKLAHVVAMLRTNAGAGIDQIMQSTGWQRHTVRGVISGAIKKKLGLEVASETRDGKRVYRIAARSVRGTASER